MIYRRFGRTELQMPVFSCGTMRFQETWDDVGWDKIQDKTQKNLETVVKKAFELGINHFETARGYGTSELQLGRALKLLPRDEIIVQTKIPLKPTPEEFEAELKTSFANLDVEYLDLCGLHGINNAAGEWTKLIIKEMSPLPKLLKINDKGADITAHILDVIITGYNKDRGIILKNMFENAKRLGFKFIITSGTKDEATSAKLAGLIPLFGSQPWWHFSTQCPPSFKPDPTEKASVNSRTGSNFCPVIIAKGKGTYGKFLEEVSQKIAASDVEGFFLDYECTMPFCYCKRCRKAFIDYTGKSDVNWPSEVKKNAKYYDSWISFRCWQGALYVKSIRDAARKALPDCPFRAWVSGYNYQNNLKTTTIDVSKAAKFLTEVEIPHYSLPYSYKDRIKFVEEGIQAIKDTVAVVDIPIIFCSSIDYPVGNTLWSDPEILDAQIMAVIGEGAQGLSFWGGHFQGAIDGRFMHKLIKWHNLLVASGKYIKNGKRRDDLLKISANKNRLYSSLRVMDNTALLTVVNLSKQQKNLNISVLGFKSKGYTLPYKKATINISTLSLKPLEGVFIELVK